MANVRWWLIFCSSVAGLILAFNLNLLRILWQNDPSFLGVSIVTLYFFVSMFAGYVTWQASRSRWDEVYPHLPLLDYFGNAMFGLGLVGSMIGFIHGMQSMDLADPAAVQANMLKVMKEIALRIQAARKRIPAILRAR